MTPGLLIIDRVVATRRIDAEAAEFLVDAMVRWDRDGGDGSALLRYLGIPTTTAKRRQAVTEVQELREAAALADERVAAVEVRAEDRAGIAEAALREALAQIAHLERWTADGDAHADTFRALLVEHAETLRATPPEAWAQTLSDLSDAAWDVVDPATGAIHETEGGGGN